MSINGLRVAYSTVFLFFGLMGLYMAYDLGDTLGMIAQLLPLGFGVGILFTSDGFMSEIRRK